MNKKLMYLIGSGGVVIEYVEVLTQTSTCVEVDRLSTRRFTASELSELRLKAIRNRRM
ncbi:hypothetical protein AB1J88_03095 [Pseudomonas sp. S8]|uniref:hypothetical protein n=1 Tax=Pseudomonas sp. S8 TaxID=211136 RepID=UPI003D281A42